MSALSSEELRDLARVALEVATKGAAHALSGFRQAKVVRHKGEKDLVTEFDTATEAVVRNELATRTPGIAVVAEEGGGRAGVRTWYVDPIDGTTNYAHGHPFWCVSIGLLEAGECVAGAVVAPALSLSWLGSRGLPTLRNGEPCRVSGARTVEESFLATGFPYDRRTSVDNNFDAFIAVKRRALGVRRCGSAAIDLCFVADGTYDGYWERKLKTWDIAAGVCMVLGAGGRVSELGGGPIDLRRGDLVASNGHLHQALVEAIGAPPQVPEASRPESPGF